MSERNRRKKMYRRRRIFAIIFMLIMAFLIYWVYKHFNTPEERARNIENASHESEYMDTEMAKIIYNNPVGQTITKGDNLVVNIEAKKNLLAFRQEKMKDHSMGRGAPQHLLKKQVYLTFDDGPSANNTSKILDILKDEGIKATFFVIGKNVEAYPEVLQRIYDEGHDIGIHTYSHNYKQIYSSADALQEDIEKCLVAIRSVLGEDFDTNLYRFPGGSWRKNKEVYVERVKDLGYVYFDWNVLNGDAETARPSEEYVLKRFNETSNGYHVILSLMHDTDAKTATVATLPRIIEDLKSEDFEFRTLGDM